SIDRQVANTSIGISVNGTVFSLDTGDNIKADNLTYSFDPLNDGKVSTGDRIVVNKVGAGTTVQLVWMPSGIDGGDKQLVGNIITF
ncbi:MAG TPA: hypothetical protein PKZ73_04345, partial [Methanomassiliicoccales archaeon]|nr:hypothetical protein [Methanomassiliicoccales archaeon]